MVEITSLHSFQTRLDQETRLEQLSCEITLVKDGNQVDKTTTRLVSVCV